MRFKPKIKVWLEINSKPVLGEGRAKLLKEIDNIGSLSKSAKNLKISYRHAFKLIKNLNKRVGEKVIETKIGGEKGGGMKLTELGKKVLNEYYLAKKKIEEFIEKEFS